MAGQQREVVWTLQGQLTLDEAVAYIAENSLVSAERLLESALEAGASLALMSERGRIVPELDKPNIREIFVQRYRLIYEIRETKVDILAFLHGARDFASWQRSINGGEAF